MKEGSHSTNSGSTKPNAWSKPLQGAAAQAPHKSKAATTMASSSSSSHAANLSNSSNKGARGGSVPPPGYTSKSAQTQQQPSSANTAAIEKTLPALRERFLHLLLSLTGQKVAITLTSGVTYAGILHTATPFSHLPMEQRNKYVLRAATVLLTGGTGAPPMEAATATASAMNGFPATFQPGSTVLLDMDHVVQVHCKACRLDALVSSSSSSSGKGAASRMGDSFTDTEISRGSAIHNNTSTTQTSRKDFVAVDATWTSAGDSTSMPPLTPINSKAAKLAGLSAHSSVANPNSVGMNGLALNGSIEGWDQFKANEELFNVVSSYDETVYTTVLDRSQISAQERHRAEQLAREIEKSTTTNIHLAEERGQISLLDDSELDEEDRYSGVLKSSSVVTLKPKLNYAQAVVSATTTITTTTTTAVPSTELVSPSLVDDVKDVNSDKVAEVNASSTMPTETATVHAISDVVPETDNRGNDGVENHVVTEQQQRNSNERTSVRDTEETIDDTQSGKSSGIESTVNTTTLADDVETKETTTADAAPEIKSKLSASAKSFSFNINAKSFQPQPSHLPPPPPPPPPQHPPQYIYDPATGMPMIIPPHMMPAGGMMPPMMNPGQYPGLRYTGQYPGMEFTQPPPLPHHHPMHPPHVPPNTGTSATATGAVSVPEDSPTPVSEEESVTQQELQQTQQQQHEVNDSASMSEPSSQQAHNNPLQTHRPPLQQPPPPPSHHQLQHGHGMPMQPHMYYPSGYYNPAMGMYQPPPQQQGGANGHPQQYITPQMAVHMQRQMYSGPGMPAGMPPNMMRGPPTYYSGPNNPVPYPPYSTGVGGGAYGSEDDTINYGGRGRGGGGRGPGGRGGRNTGRGQGRSGGMSGGRNGGGRGRFNHQYSGGSSSLGDNSGRETPHDTQSSSPPPTQPTAAAAAVVPAIVGQGPEPLTTTSVTTEESPVGLSSSPPPNHQKNAIPSDNSISTSTAVLDASSTATKVITTEASSVSNEM